jgi:hypothetical protein
MTVYVSEHFGFQRHRELLTPSAPLASYIGSSAVATVLNAGTQLLRFVNDGTGAAWVAFGASSTAGAITSTNSLRLSTGPGEQFVAAPAGPNRNLLFQTST